MTEALMPEIDTVPAPVPVLRIGSRSSGPRPRAAVVAAVVAAAGLAAWRWARTRPGGIRRVAAAWRRGKRLRTDSEVRHLVEHELATSSPAGTDVDVEVVDGAVTLRGEIALREDAEEILALLGAVTGVREVQGLLHLPGGRVGSAAPVLDL